MTKRRAGLVLAYAESTTINQRRDRLPPFLFAPCEWREPQRFCATGYLRVFIDGHVSGSEMDSDGTPWLTWVGIGDYIVRGDDDNLDVLNKADFRRLVKVARQ